MEVIKDKIGTPITEGCYIAYGHALGRCAGIRIGKIVSIKEVKPKYGHDITTRITVRGIDDDWNFKKAKPLSRNSTLMFPDRMIVLDEDKVPESYREMLEQF